MQIGVSLRVAELATMEGDYPLARETLERTLPYLEGARMDVQSAFLVLLATTSTHQGDLPAARRFRARHAVLLDGQDDPLRRQYDALNEAVGRLTEGDIPGAEAVADQVQRAVANLGIGLLAPQVPLLRALCALCDQRPADAERHLDALGDTPLTASSPHQRDAVRAAAAWMAGDDPEHHARAAQLLHRARTVRVHGMPGWLALAEAMVGPDLTALAALGDGRPVHGIVRLVARAVAASPRGNSR